MSGEPIISRNHCMDAGPATGAGVAIVPPAHGDYSTATAITAAPTSGQKWAITDIFIAAVAACEVHLEEETSTTVIFGPVPLAANGWIQFKPRGKLKLPTADRKVLLHSSTSDHVTCQISAVSEA